MGVSSVRFGGGNSYPGFRNLAGALAVIADVSMASLGVFVAAELKLEIEACS